jgi:hypothetical protein
MKIDTRVNEPTDEGIIEIDGDRIRVFTERGYSFDIVLSGRNQIEIISMDGAMTLEPFSSNRLRCGVQVP